EEERAIAELRARTLRGRRANCGIPERMRGLTFEQLRRDPPPEAALASAEAWASGNLNGLVLAGPVGVGKSWLAAAAAWARLELAPLRWIYVPRLFTFLDAGFDSKGRAEALEALASSTPIVLDDLDKARPTEFAATHLQTAISVRVDEGLPLLVTTNRS